MDRLVSTLDSFSDHEKTIREIFAAESATLQQAVIAPLRDLEQILLERGHQVFIEEGREFNRSSEGHASAPFVTLGFLPDAQWCRQYGLEKWAQIHFGLVEHGVNVRLRAENFRGPRIKTLRLDKVVPNTPQAIKDAAAGYIMLILEDSKDL